MKRKINILIGSLHFFFDTRYDRGLGVGPSDQDSVGSLEVRKREDILISSQKLKS